jgi:SAM-dependent methyltransferase/molybdopterin converting factor small subunit
VAIVFVPAPLRRLTDGKDRLAVAGHTVGALIDAIERTHPGFRERVVEHGELRSSLAVSVDGDLVTRGLDEPVGDASEVHFVPALGGGQDTTGGAPASPDAYRRIFELRGGSYNAAHALAPDARATERALLLERLDLRAGLRVLDVPAGGGWVADGLGAHGVTTVCLEPAAAFAAGIDAAHPRVRGALVALPFAAATFDRVGSLAGTHHLEDRLAFFRECRRVLRPGGRLVVADAAADSPAARFLNGPVDRFTATGHDGHFFAAGEATDLLLRAGFVDAREAHVPFAWTFPDRATLVRFCALLFGLVRAAEADVAAALDASFAISEAADGRASLPWSLVYASARAG